MAHWRLTVVLGVGRIDDTKISDGGVVRHHRRAGREGHGPYRYHDPVWATGVGPAGVHQDKAVCLSANEAQGQGTGPDTVTRLTTLVRIACMPYHFPQEMVVSGLGPPHRNGAVEPGQARALQSEESCPT